MPYGLDNISGKTHEEYDKFVVLISMRKGIGWRRFVMLRRWWWISFAFSESFGMVRFPVLRVISFPIVRITNLLLEMEMGRLRWSSKMRSCNPCKYTGIWMGFG